MVLPRVLTALVGAPLFLWVAYLGSIPFFLFVLFLISLALWEFLQMAETGGYASQGWVTYVAGVLLMLSLAFPGVRLSMPFASQGPAFVLTFIVFLFLFREMVRRDKGLSLLRVAVSLTALFVIAWPLSHIFLLRDLRGASSPDLYHVGRNCLFYLLLLIWAQDIGAWAVGLLFGKRRLAVQISPKKSWEGAAAGLGAALLTGLLCQSAFLGKILTLPETIILSLGLGVVAQISDLMESLIKRCLGVKDSSNLLPGHGGLLDRFDSFLFSAPLLYYYLVMTGRGG
ncbi:MAG TPA: phosphatidate cytidylyltransferase [Elusimicrobiota bacterium]|nr:phosphatidate cytidylyltransferase [Elusimicrobiota bacterium]